MMKVTEKGDLEIIAHAAFSYEVFRDAALKIAASEEFKDDAGGYLIRMS